MVKVNEAAPKGQLFFLLNIISHVRETRNGLINIPPELK
jgi:hypothetical protein